MTMPKLSISEARFSAQRSEYYSVSILEDGTIESKHGHGRDRRVSEKGHLFPDLFDHDLPTGSDLLCILQRQRPLHISLRPDPLPFGNIAEATYLFGKLALPTSYFDIADGLLSTAHYTTIHTQQLEVSRFELIANCVNKQGNWALALIHSSVTGHTSVFWSLDQRIDSNRLTEELLARSRFAVHPMLIPCIMLDTTLRQGLERRQMIKERIKVLEDALYRTDAPSPASARPAGESSDFESLFALLQRCRKDQASRRGRYDFWRSLRNSIEEGFQYFERLPPSTNNDSLRFEAHSQLKRGAELTWQRLKSLMARDQDHIDRVENLSQTLYNLVQQRDIRLQSEIARAAQRDSEDMKYIAVLGSIFLPASLIATILNVPEFQFLPGAQLFGAYVGITVPFVAFVVYLCVSRPPWIRKFGPGKGETARAGLP